MTALDAGTIGVDAGLGLYVFGVARDLKLPSDLPRLPGGGSVRAFARGDLVAIVSEVDRSAVEIPDTEDEAALRRLAELAVGHDEVLVRVAAASGALIPLRLGTVLAGERAMETVLDEHAAALGTELDRVAGHSEWAATAVVPESAEPTAGGSDPEAPTGTNYLVARQQQRRAAEEARRGRDQIVVEIHERLSGRAAEAATVPPRRGAPHRDHHGVYLVADLPAFHAEVAALRADHPEVELDVSGPWPPYHFTAVQLGEGAPPPEAPG